MKLLDELKEVPKRTYILIALNFFIIAIAFYIFAELAETVLEQEKFIVDRKVSQWVEGVRTDTGYSIFSFITELGSVQVITIGSIILAAILFFIYQRRKWRIIYFAVAIIGIGLLTKTLKTIYSRERPNIFEEYDGTGFSFPSGHSTAPMVFYGFIIYLIIRSQQRTLIKWLAATPLGLLILAIGYSRVYLGVHFITDVMAGHLIGLAWLVSCIQILEYTLWRKNL